MEPRPNLKSFCCVHPDCPRYGQRAADTLTVRKIYGHDRIRSPRRSQQGRPPAPLVRVPRDLVYAQGGKHRRNGRGVSVEIRPLFGKGNRAGGLATLGWKRVNPSAIERFTRTDRCRNRRKASS